MVSSWDQGPEELSGGPSEALDSKPTGVRKRLPTKEPGQGLCSLARDLSLLGYEQELLAFTSRKIPFDLWMSFSMKLPLTTPKLLSEGSWVKFRVTWHPGKVQVEWACSSPGTTSCR